MVTEVEGTGRTSKEGRGGRRRGGVFRVYPGTQFWQRTPRGVR